MSVQEQIQTLIDENPVVLFMKGNKLFPQCGFSGKCHLVWVFHPPRANAWRIRFVTRPETRDEGDRDRGGPPFAASIAR